MCGGAVFRIRIHWIPNHAVEIRIRNQIHVLDDKQFKNFQFNFLHFLIKKCNIFVLQCPWRDLKLQAKPPAPKDNIQNFTVTVLQHINSKLFSFFFIGNFCLPGSCAYPPPPTPFYSWLLICNVWGDDDILPCGYFLHGIRIEVHTAQVRYYPGRYW